MARRGSRPVTTIVLVAGAGVLLWCLLRGTCRGWLSAGPTGAQGPLSSTPPVMTPCQVFIRRQHIDLDGAPVELSDVVARCRATGRAEVRVTGDAVVRTIGEVVRALQGAGVAVYASDTVWESVHVTDPTPEGSP
jgi:hypothetical protein